METVPVHGTTPTGNAPRELDLWLADGRPSELHLWIHAPGASNTAGWEIRVSPAELLEALRALGVK